MKLKLNIDNDGKIKQPEEPNIIPNIEPNIPNKKKANNSKSNTLSILSIIFAIILPIVGLILGIIGVKKSNKKLSIIGIIVSILTTVSVGLLIFMLFFNNKPTTYGYNSYTKVIKTYYMAMDKQDISLAYSCYPENYKPEVDFSSITDQYKFYTKKLNITNTSDGDIDTYKNKYNMNFITVTNYNTLCDYEIRGDQNYYSRYELNIVIGEINNKYYILDVEDIGDIAKHSDNNIDYATIDDATIDDAEITEEITTEEIIADATPTETATSNEPVNITEKIGSNDVGYINTSALGIELLDISDQNIFNVNTSTVSNYIFYSNFIHTININMYEIDNFSSKLDTYVDNVRKDFEKQIKNSSDSDIKTFTVEVTDCKIGTKNIKGKLIKTQIKPTTITSLGIMNLDSYFWENDGKLYQVEIIYSNDNTQLIKDLIRKYKEK